MAYARINFPNPAARRNSSSSKKKPNQPRVFTGDGNIRTDPWIVACDHAHNPPLGFHNPPSRSPTTAFGLSTSPHPAPLSPMIVSLYLATQLLILLPSLCSLCHRKFTRIRHPNPVDSMTTVGTVVACPDLKSLTIVVLRLAGFFDSFATR